MHLGKYDEILLHPGLTEAVINLKDKFFVFTVLREIIAVETKYEKKGLSIKSHDFYFKTKISEKFNSLLLITRLSESIQNDLMMYESEIACRHKLGQASRTKILQNSRSANFIESVAIIL